MIPNRSPWIVQLHRERPAIPLSTDIDGDVVIVGGGIAGVVTAFFTLRDTDKNVVLLEADKVAHGATGHNAGQITSYFERPLSELVREFGLDLAIDGQRSVESAWMLIDEILTTAKLRTPLYRFTGYAGLSHRSQVLLHLENNHHRVEGGLPTEDMLVAQEWAYVSEIPKEFEHLYSIVPQKDLLELLETKNTGYVASLSYPKGCMNSAVFTEELLGYLVATYPSRFSFYEESPVQTICLREHSALLTVLSHTVSAQRVVLATNGFANFSIINESGDDIDTAFHHLVNGRIGYMAAYAEPLNNPPAAISYFPKNRNYVDDPTGENYFYLTRRPFEHENASFNLISVGGPDTPLPNGATYERASSCAEDVGIRIDDFLSTNYRNYPPEPTEYPFCWHGLMGYTPSGVRRVGAEPCNPILLYNLGCNGVGILPSIYGSKRISEILKGAPVAKSIFDPHDQRKQA